ncbi:embryogenesis-associated protein emb8-like [Stylonychia lemnae]|uniref:Embryogenesis-associated protein emb8-like n=1 Tax=Stylonychia lemnae TaxID=5949 RepID=A0A077ZN12_STYLE|nr:embryogenesis-associated protein emb8-like [Stylonychia lemnae]|eukprot:CDW71298.1 embryogenesis-associated protein emb8-like [Stylonychia lemnae]
MKEGGSISIDWVYPLDDVVGCKRETRICMIFPGMSGNSDRGYIKCLVQHLSQEKGYIVGVFHNRGIQSEYTSPMFLDITSSSEIDAALKHMQQKFQNKAHPRYVGVGLSLGANLMLKIAGEQKEKFPLEAMVSLSNPFDLWKVLCQMKGNVFERNLVKEYSEDTILKQSPSVAEQEIILQMKEKYELNFEKIRQARSWKELDQEFTMKVHYKYDSPEEYYRASSCKNVIQDIQKPVLVIHAKDDPVTPLECIPLEECRQNKNMIVQLLNKGGHLCFFQGLFGNKRWYPQVISEYLDAVLGLDQIKEESQY